MYIRICLTFYLRNRIRSEIDTFPIVVDLSAVDLPPVETSPPQYESCRAKRRVAGSRSWKLVAWRRTNWHFCYVSCQLYITDLFCYLATFLYYYETSGLFYYVYYYNKIKYSFGFFFIFPLIVRWPLLIDSLYYFIFDCYFFSMYLILVLCIYLKLFVFFCTGCWLMMWSARKEYKFGIWTRYATKYRTTYRRSIT